MSTIQQFKKPQNLKRHNYSFVIETRSTIIKPITHLEITENYVSWLNDKENNQYLEVRHHKQSKQSIEKYINFLRSNENCEMFAIFNKKNQKHIGNLTITSFNIYDNGTVDFGLMIGDKNSRLMGVGAEAHLAFLEFIFSYDQITRVNANVASENIIALRTLESVGYVKEGQRRNYFPLLNGNKCDVIYYGMLREDWNKRKSKLSLVLKDIKILRSQ
tara:strand:+ start:2758 stop:3408 length:651 start_codon:yes stop_codon:yes gene_type:complete